MKASFNHACNGVCFRFSENKGPEVLVVDYVNEKGKIEVRFPGGTVQHVDVLKTIEWFMNKKQIGSSDPILWLPMIIIDEEKKFKSKVSAAIGADRHTKNLLLEESLSVISTQLESCHLTDGEKSEIMDECKILTIIREVMEETAAVKFGEWYKTGVSMVGNHARCGYVTVEANAPDSFEGSGDRDIKSSYWMPVEGIERILCVKHLNYFQSAIKKAVENKIHSRIEELNVFNTATNH